MQPSAITHTPVASTSGDSRASELLSLRNGIYSPGYPLDRADDDQPFDSVTFIKVIARSMLLLCSSADSLFLYSLRRSHA